MMGDQKKAPTQEQRLRSVELTVDGMRTAFNRNHKAYAEAIACLDGHFAVMRAVINDIYRNAVTTDGDGNIDWDVYYGWYNEHLRKQADLEKQTAESSPVAVVDNIPATEEQLFGGDYGGRTGPVPQGVESTGG